MVGSEQGDQLKETAGGGRAGADTRPLHDLPDLEHVPKAATLAIQCNVLTLNIYIAARDTHPRSNVKIQPVEM